MLLAVFAELLFAAVALAALSVGETVAALGWVAAAVMAFLWLCARSERRRSRSGDERGLPPALTVRDEQRRREQMRRELRASVLRRM